MTGAIYDNRRDPPDVGRHHQPRQLRSSTVEADGAHPNEGNALFRLPRHELRPLVRSIWSIRRESSSTTLGRERLLPTGRMTVVFRVESAPLRLVESNGVRTFDRAVVGGARSTHYVKEFGGPICSVGIELEPGAASVLLHSHADELAGCHTNLRDLWGDVADEAYARLAETQDDERRIEIFEQILCKQLRPSNATSPIIQSAISELGTTSNIGSVVQRSGYSHRRFTQLFRRATGLTPKLYCRVHQFQQAVRLLSNQASPVNLPTLAIDAGYSDQPHLNRAFREFAGLTPAEYHRLRPKSMNHVPLQRTP